MGSLVAQYESVGLRSGLLPGPGEQAHRMKSRLAACTTVCLYEKKGTGKVPEAGGAGGTNFNCPALKTLRDAPASTNGGQQEKEGDASD